MSHADLIFALESSIEANGLESVLRTLADTLSEKSDMLFGGMGFGIDSWGLDDSSDDWAKAAALVRDVCESLPDSTR